MFRQSTLPLAPHPSMRAGSSRRSFLRQIIFAQRPAVEEPGNHALVCIFLRGGADTLNMVVPHGDDDYYRNRPTLSISRPGKGKDAAIKLDDFYGFHPRMEGLVPLYKEGRLGIVQAVGSDNFSGSHFEAQDQMEHGEGWGENLGGGWLGRYLRSRGGSSPLSGIALGATLPESLRGAPAASAFRSVDEMQLPGSSAQSAVVSRALSKLYATEVGIIGQQGQETLDLLHRVERLRTTPYTPAGGAIYPDDDFGAGLREIARIVKANLGMEVACIDLGGWDTHFFQGTTAGLQVGNIDTLSRGLAAFDADLKGYRDRVTTIVMTEFGRRLYENASSGTDHGRGFAFIALGEKIAGGKIHGAWPGLKEEPSLPGPGGMDVRTDYRSVLCEILANALGHDTLASVFPGFSPQAVGIAKAPPAQRV